MPVLLMDSSELRAASSSWLNWFGQSNPLRKCVPKPFAQVGWWKYLQPCSYRFVCGKYCIQIWRGVYCLGFGFFLMFSQEPALVGFVLPLLHEKGRHAPVWFDHLRFFIYIYIYDIFTHLPGLVRTCDTKSSTGGAPMTARHMDSLIRLAEANARIELRHHAPLLLQPLGVASNMEKTPQLLVVDPWTPNSQPPFFRGFVSVLGSVPSPSNVKMDEKCWILACMTCLLKVKMDTVSDLGGTVLTPVWNSINLTPIGRRWNSNERADKMGSAELWLPERKASCDFQLAIYGLDGRRCPFCIFLLYIV